YEIETGYDYAFVEASTDGGATWKPVATNLSDTSGDLSGYNGSKTGLTGSTHGEWVSLTSNSSLPAGTDALRFRYQTDGGVAKAGFQVDNINVGSTNVGDAESIQGWQFDGFRITTGSEVQSFGNYYVAENRQYIDYDKSLRTGYNFGFLDSRPNWVEDFPYQDGLLINYWDTSQLDNNVGDHPGAGLILPIDANPEFAHTYDGQLWRPRVLSYDSTFGLGRTDAFTLHKDSIATHFPSHPAVSTFDDRNTYWFNRDKHAVTGSHIGRYQPGWVGVDVPHTGTLVRVNSISSTGFMKVSVLAR
ncbi:MAG: peptidase M6, partial [Candidatus Nanopelagicales bacterium]